MEKYKIPIQLAFARKFRIHTIFILFLLASPFTTVYAQNAVSGVVSDEKGKGIEGVNVVVKGTNTGVVTDKAGRYTISVPGATSILVFSSTGYGTQEQTVGDKKL